MRKRDRQATIDGYLAETGADAFVPAAFLAWLEERPDHPAHPWFFTISDEAAARRWREDRVRAFVSDLRVVVRYAVAEDPETKIVRVAVGEMPLMISPRDRRATGGGYVHFDPSDRAHVAELLGQAGEALAQWVRRYGAAVERDGRDLSQLRMLAEDLEGVGAVVVPLALGKESA